MARTETRDRILDTSSRLFRRQGFSSTGIKQLIEASGSTGGSLYHFFPEGKEELAIATINRYGEKYARLLDAVGQSSGHPAESVGRFFQLAAEALLASNFGDGCPIGTMALDVAGTNENILVACAMILKAWQERLAGDLIKAGVGAREAASLGYFVLSTLEGAILLSRALRDTSPLRESDIHTRKLLEAAVGRDVPDRRRPARAEIKRSRPNPAQHPRKK